MKRVKTFKEFINENYNEDFVYSAEITKAWKSLSRIFSKGSPKEIELDEFSLKGVFSNSLVGVWGEDDGNDYSTINVIIHKGDDSKKLFTKFKGVSAMDWSYELEGMGLDEFEIMNFPYEPKSNPKSAIKAGKEAESYIKNNI